MSKKPQQSCFFPKPGEAFDPILAKNRMDNARAAAGAPRYPITESHAYARTGALRTETEAADRVLRNGASQRVMALRLFYEAGDKGLTDDELVRLHRSEVGKKGGVRRQELVERHGMVENSGRTRLTDTGSEAVVWVINQEGINWIWANPQF